MEPYTDSEQPFLNAESVFLKRGSGEAEKFSVASVRPHKRVFLMEFKELHSIEEAEARRGAEVFLPEEALGPKEQDEFYWHELLGLEVFLDSGERLGKVSRIIATGANDVYVVREDKREILLPATLEVVKEVDLEKGRMVVSPMEGLLDLNEV